MAVLIGALGIVFGSIFNQPINQFLPYVASGIILWSFIFTILSEGSLAFISSESLILQIRLSLLVHILRIFYRNIIILAHNILILVVVLLVCKKPLVGEFFLVIPGFIILTLNLLWITIILAIVSTRFRDTPQIIQNILQVGFYVTPIFWNINELQGKYSNLIFIFNPIFSFIDIVRSPLLGEFPRISSWVISIAILLLGSIATIPFFRRYKSRIPFWL